MDISFQRYLLLLVLLCATTASLLSPAHAFTVVPNQLNLYSVPNNIMSSNNNNNNNRRRNNNNNGRGGGGANMELFLSQVVQSKTAGKNRDQELVRFAAQMKLDVSQLKEALRKQRPKLANDSEKALYIDWILHPTHDDSKIKVDNNAVHSVFNATKVSDPSLLTTVTFQECPGLHPLSKRALTGTMGLQAMTEIQAKTFAAGAAGKDVLGRARTGTGKTLAFLMPAVERILSAGSMYQSGRNVGILVISPTRELAAQIGDQAEKLLEFHKGLTVQVVYGGTKITRDQNMMNKRLPTVLVATPGRLLDHMQSTDVVAKGSGKRSFASIMSETNLLVLDEADRLCDQGFMREIHKIMKFLPPQQTRQTLLFSATIPPEIKTIMATNMKKDYVEVDCINDKDAGSSTHIKVKQSHVVLPELGMDGYVKSVVDVILHALSQDDEENHKVVVFFTTARMVAFFATFFNEGLNIPVIELHSKKSQSYRNNASNTFREAKKAVLFTSDVSARGVDYPDVTQVMQFGLPESREQYIHRLGRTGRAGKDGKGLLVLASFEKTFLSELKGVDVPRNAAISDMLNDPMQQGANAHLVEAVIDRVKRGDKVLTSSAQGAYQAFLGYYLGQMRRMRINSKETLVEYANQLAGAMGLTKIPELSKKLVGKMGLKGVSGIVLGEGDEPSRGGGGRGGGGRGGGGRGGGRGGDRRGVAPGGKREHSQSRRGPPPKKEKFAN
jgi:ATP-dependent RNA helicase MSS116